MERTIAEGLRRCMRIRTSRSYVTVNPSYYVVRTPCAAQVCHLTTNKTASRQTPQIFSRVSHTIRSYSTANPTVQGTIGKGADGIVDEVSRIKEQLSAPEHLNEKERQIWEMLMEELDCTELEVQDISGGCGSMYGIDIVSEKFRGLNMLKQQRLVNQVLGEEIKTWHGVQLKTRAP